MPQLHIHKGLWPLLSGLVFLCVSGNSLVWVFCPHMIEGPYCHVRRESHVHSDETLGGASGQMDHMQMDDSQMPDMDMDNMSMDMSGAKMEHGKVAQPLSIDLIGHEIVSVGYVNGAANAEAVTQRNEPCSHCMLHSGTVQTFPVSVAVQNNASHPIIAADTVTRVRNAFPAAQNLLELHDHGPPGPSEPVYILLTALRI